jgi:hypothetical protein
LNPRHASPDGNEPNSPDYAFLAQAFAARMFKQIQRQEGQITVIQCKSEEQAAEEHGATAQPDDRSLADAKPSPKSTPPSELTRQDFKGMVSQAEYEKQTRAVQDLTRQLRKYQGRVVKLEADAEAARMAPASNVGIEFLLGRGDHSDIEVIDFAIEAQAAGNLLSSWGQARLAGQLVTDLEFLPPMLVQSISMGFYRLVQQLRDHHRVPLYQSDSQRAGDAIARFLMGKSVGALADGVRALSEGMAFDETVCVLQDATMSLGPSSKVVPRTFVIGQPGSRMFRKAIVVPDPTGGASA